jgi:ArsR family metal-binding transcriptional regulator
LSISRNTISSRKERTHGRDHLQNLIFNLITKNRLSDMDLNDIEQVLPFLSDMWKLRIIAHLNSPPYLKELAEMLNARYSESLGVVLVRLGRSFLLL